MANPLCLTSNVFKDPHLNFAFGGNADFRGRHGVLYNFLSAPGLSVNIKTEEAIFKIHDGALTVNGSFLTEAHVVARVGAVGGHAGHKATASFWSTELNEHNWGFQVVNGSCGGRPFKFGKRGEEVLRAHHGNGALFGLLRPAGLDRDCPRNALCSKRPGLGRGAPPSAGHQLRQPRLARPLQATRTYRPVVCHPGPG